jgi:(S)-ureidoglycine aminohydrolase
MLAQQLGFSRTSLKQDHFFQTSDSFVRAPLPGMAGGTAVIHVGPAIGALFTQYTAELQPGGKLGFTSAQRFLYVRSGSVRLDGELLASGSFAFVPQGETHEVVAAQEATLVVIEKPFVEAAHGWPARVLGNVQHVVPQPLMGDDGVLVQALLPDSPEFDCAVNLMTFAPGAALGMVEAHIMEHGLMMLEGGGIYRLGDCWYSIMSGDFIWMAPYCPQWFGAIGKAPAKYLIYKDWNRHPL